MDSPSQISIAEAWREHVLASVKWSALADHLSMDAAMSVSVLLDLYLGGTIRHEYSEGRILCHGCQYIKNDQVEVGSSRGLDPACACHVGVVQAFTQGVLGGGFLVNREIENYICHLILHPIA